MATDAQIFIPNLSICGFFYLSFWALPLAALSIAIPNNKNYGRSLVFLNWEISIAIANAPKPELYFFKSSIPLPILH